MFGIGHNQTQSQNPAALAQFGSFNQNPVPGGGNSNGMMHGARANMFKTQQVPTAPLAANKRPVKSGGGASGRYDYSAKQSLSGIFDSEYESAPPQSALDRMAKKPQPNFGLNSFVNEHTTSVSELL